MKTLVEKEKIAVVLTGEENKRILKSIKEIAGWLELRFDYFIEKFSGKDFCIWAKSVRKLTDAKIIGTVRWCRERQDKNFIIPDKKRITIYRSIMEYVDFCDVEINSKIAKDVCNLAKANNKKIILSYHNFAMTPSRKKLISICKKAKNLNPDIIKIATSIRTTKDLFNLVSVSFSVSKNSKVVVVPMNTTLVERLVPLAFGSLFTYFTASQKTAPGQPLLGSIILK
ncbi:MAG: type I 3-dehydroquinate dehydratase [Candidatus Omnitrophica bacterium]|nr:type I 3-dehydroquinate dehydratase [Candidatus Omnitrophota bacterium]